MAVFDYSILCMCFWLCFNSKSPKIAQIITTQFAVLFAFDYFFIQGEFYKHVGSQWFYLVKVYLLFVVIGVLYFANASKGLIAVLVGTMFYNSGLWYEEITQKYGFFDTYFTPFMVSSMLLQLLYLIGINTSAHSVMVSSRRYLRRVFDNVFHFNQHSYYSFY